MQKIKYILLLLLLIGSFSCKKEIKKTIIDGIVRDFATGNPLEGAEVYVQVRLLEIWNPPFVYHTAYSAITGVDGKFKFEFRAEKKYSYSMEYQKPSQCYFDYDSPQGINEGEINTIDKKLFSKTTLNIHVKNISPFDTNDHICYYLTKEVTGCITSGSYGMTVDYTTAVDGLNAYAKIYIKSFVTKNSILNIYLDSVILSPCMPLTYDLFY